MTDFNNNNKFVPTAPKTYEVRYLENKQSGLSPAARAKVIKMHGSNYLSENQGGYGPCSTCGVSSKPFKLNMDLRNCAGDHLYGSASNTDEAMNESALILQGSGKWEGGKDDKGCFRRANRENLVSKINAKIAEHLQDEGGDKGKGKSIIESVWNDANS